MSRAATVAVGLQPEIGPTVGDALRAADDVEPREQSRDDRAGDGLVVAHRDGIDRATVAASITAIEFGECH